MLCGMLLDNKIINMNNIINIFLLAGDKFMPEIHLRQPQFVDKACFQDDKKSMGSGDKKLKNSSLILADQLHKPVIKKFKKIKVYSQFKDNIWGLDLADMQSISKKIKVLSIFYVL